jgi:ribosomal protein S25|tara:strand:- start:127 stop:378 length:252 start_codon:yes stop_codon:yes gene_type:complete
MAKFEPTGHDDIIETIVDYKKGLRNKLTAPKILAEQMGISLGAASAFLKEMKRGNVTQIRGYEKTPEHIVKGRTGRSNQKKNF